MLQTMRDNSQGIVAKILVGFIVVVFALWGVDSLVGLATAEPPPAEVNGVDVSQEDLFRGVELQRRQILSQMGANADPALLDEGLLRTTVLNALIDRTLSMESAESQGMHVSEEMLDQLIVSTPQFQVDGRFNRDQFEAVLRSAGYTPLSYRKLLREETLIAQERRAYAASSFMTPAEVDRLLDLSRQTRDIRYVQVNPDSETVEVTEQEIADAYEARAENLVTPEQLVVDYVILERSAFADPEAVSEAEINGAYEILVADFEGQEQRSASHILFEVSDAQSVDEALARAAEVRAEILAGGDFAQLAKENSADIGSAEQGGDLGYLEAGLFEGPFDDTLFALSVGEVSEPVETEFGVHLIQLNDIRSTAAPLLVEVAEDLREQIATEKAEVEYVAALERLADLSFSSGDLVAPSEELGLEIQTSEPFSRSGGENEFAQPRVLTAAFSDTVLVENLNSDPIELDSGRTLVLHLNEQIPSKQLSLEDVRDQLVAEITRTKAVAEAALKADQLLEQARSGSDAIEWIGVESVARNAGTELDPSIVESAFALAKPANGEQDYTVVQLLDGSSVVLTVDAVGVAEDAFGDAERASISGMLASRRGDLSYQQQFEAYKAGAEIKVN